MGLIGVALGSFAGALGFLASTFSSRAFWFSIAYFTAVGFLFPSRAPDVFGNALRAVSMGLGAFLGMFSGPSRADEDGVSWLSVGIVALWVVVVAILLYQMPPRVA
jgi:hypothetical protein